MFSIPIPFIEKGPGETYLHAKGYEVEEECCSDVTINLSGASISIDLTPVTDRLDKLLEDTTQTIVTVTTAGIIPAGSKMYKIINLGTNPSDPINNTYNTFTVDGQSVTENAISIGNDLGGVKGLASAVSYNPNGNTLLLIYNT